MYLTRDLIRQKRDIELSKEAQISQRSVGLISGDKCSKKLLVAGTRIFENPRYQKSSYMMYSRSFAKVPALLLLMDYHLLANELYCQK